MPQLAPDPKLESLARQTLKCLFDSGGQIVSSECLPGFGNSQIFIRVLDTGFRIIQTDSLTAYAAPRHDANNWQSVESLLMAIDSENQLPLPPVYGSLAELGAFLESRLPSVNDALSRKRFVATLEAARQAMMKDLVTLNRRVAVQPSATRRGLDAAVQGIAKTFRFLTPQPKDNLARFLPIGSDAALEQQVKQEFGNLFRSFGAQINSNGRVGIMDFATVTFDAGNLCVRASRDRGTVDISIAPLHAVREWHNLGVASLSLQEDVDLVQPAPSSMVPGAGRLLDREFVKLSEAFSAGSYPATRKRIRELNASLRQKWIENFNQKGKSYRATTP
jgi:hypothetical protein